MDSYKNEIVVYQPNETLRLDVRLDGETVWLTQEQMSILFGRDQSVIARHIGNAFSEGEVDKANNMQILHNIRRGQPLRLYSLDVIISVGYRVKSLNGVKFRKWATKVLREYLLKGYVVNDRIERLERKVREHDEQIGMFIRTSLPPVEGVLFEGQICDAYATVLKIIKRAKKSLVLIDNYIDETVLMMLGARGRKVVATIYTRKISQKLKLDIEKYNAQYVPIEVRHFNGSHDRFLIVDNEIVYHIGASVKDLGRTLCAFSRLTIPAGEILAQVSASGD